MTPRKTPLLTLEFIRLAGTWRQRELIAKRLQAAMPLLLRLHGGLTPNRYGITIALTDDEHQQGLNHQFRGVNRSTNVLSFPQYDKKQLKRLMPQAEPVFLGDISLAQPYCAAEARENGKNLTNHIIHLVIHGILHILGHDHQTARQAALMEQLERDVLAGMKIADPYAIKADIKRLSGARRNPRKA